MAQILVVDQRMRERLRALQEYAKENIITADRLKLMVEGKVRPIGDNENFSVYIPLGYRAVFSIEEQPIGLCRHLSISVARHAKLPNPQAVEEVMKYLGFIGGVTKCQVWIENKIAINVLQPYTH
jgi:hypothetical protein